ncbi:thiol-disulfide isomerase/thioredoxin [Gracilibacillus halotolerans]|uniref:Thiol-disulfide isomerase/thioredoxin n=1 Tax=Gracilibacillus halotolerans TaxID=74386 RepID=A0A841RHV9_9BACI|nr:redoxin domain-containing protein [Gracilibacillus halotolerans]MBB6512069.1 thiol-disulfide isomerase/thioredoxin [Gracilibacillus halotolerans]
MKKWVIIAIIVGMLGWTIFDYVQSTTDAAEENVSAEQGDLSVGLDIGNLAPDFELETLDGETMALSDFQGKTVMINFWATWCPPCRAEMPDMQKFHEDTDVVILAVNLTDSEARLIDVRNFKDEYELTFPILLDTHVDVANLYAIQPIPTTYIVDGNGVITYRAFGAMNYELMVQEYEKTK